MAFGSTDATVSGAVRSILVWAISQPQEKSVDQDHIVYMLLKSDWLCKRSRLRLQMSRKSLARSDRFILESTGRIVQFDTDYRQLPSDHEWADVEPGPLPGWLVRVE